MDWTEEEGKTRSAEVKEIARSILSGRAGGFHRALGKAIVLADAKNRERLRRGFGDLMDELEPRKNLEGVSEELKARIQMATRENIELQAREAALAKTLAGITADMSGPFECVRYSDSIEWWPKP